MSRETLSLLTPLFIRASCLDSYECDPDDINSVINDLLGKMNEQRIRHPNHATASLEAYVRLPLLIITFSHVLSGSGTLVLSEKDIKNLTDARKWWNKHNAILHHVHFGVLISDLRDTT